MCPLYPFFKCLFLNIFRISPGLPNVTDYSGGDCDIIQNNIMILYIYV